LCYAVLCCVYGWGQCILVSHLQRLFNEKLSFLHCFFLGFLLMCFAGFLWCCCCRACAFLSIHFTLLHFTYTYTCLALLCSTCLGACLLLLLQTDASDTIIVHGKDTQSKRKRNETIQRKRPLELPPLSPLLYHNNIPLIFSSCRSPLPNENEKVGPMWYLYA